MVGCDGGQPSACHEGGRPVDAQKRCVDIALGKVLVHMDDTEGYSGGVMFLLCPLASNENLSQ